MARVAARPAPGNILSPEPDHAQPPGETLAEELEARGMTQKDSAEAMGRPAKVISEIVHGKKSITAETALQLEAVLGVSATFWMNHQTLYNLVQARARMAAAAKR